MKCIGAIISQIEKEEDEIELYNEMAREIESEGDIKSSRLLNEIADDKRTHISYLESIAKNVIDSYE